MLRSKLFGILVAGCLFASSHFASATALATHPFDCKLTQNVSPWGIVSGDRYGNGTFTNNSGGTARAMCSVPFQDGAYNFQVGTGTTVTGCIMKTTSLYGGVSLYSPTSSGGGVWYFYVPVTAGTYATELECVLPNGGQMFYMGNY